MDMIWKNSRHSQRMHLLRWEIDVVGQALLTDAYTRAVEGDLPYHSTAEDYRRCVILLQRFYLQEFYGLIDELEQLAARKGVPVAFSHCAVLPRDDEGEFMLTDGDGYDVGEELEDRLRAAYDWQDANTKAGITHGWWNVGLMRPDKGLTPVGGLCTA